LLILLFRRASEEGLRKLQAMEEAFTKLKQVTGVKNVEEMHEKFSTQKSNKLQLELEVKDAEHRLASAKKSFTRLETTFQELKSSGSGVAELNRENINRLEELYSEARNDSKSIRADAERISSVLLGLHQGSQGLLQRVQPYQYLIEGGVFELTQLGEETSPWTETVDALTTAEHVRKIFLSFKVCLFESLI
jgi:chromosome segregation ATPase